MKVQQIEVMIRKPGQAERRAMLGLGVTHLGRAEDNDVVLTDIGVSRRHARLLVQPTGVWIEDLGSGNGTYFQGSRVSRQLLKDGDEILIDPFLLRFEIPDEEAASEEGLTGELEEVDDDDTVRVPAGAPPSASATETGPVLPRARLITLNGQRLAPSYPIRAKGLTIGRSDARDVILFDPAASRNHARLELVGNDVWLRDDSSGNGTFVNALRVREQCLRHGDRVRVGSTEFRFELLDAIASEPPTVPPKPREVSVVKKLDRAPAVPDTRTLPILRSGVAVAVIAVAATVLMMVVGGAAALYASDFKGLGVSSASQQQLVSQTPTLPLSERRKFKSHFSRGDTFFDDGEYLLAAAQYYAALKIDPASTPAERMGVTSCEYLLLDNIRATLELQALSDGEKQSRRLAALKLGRRAVRGRAKSDEAVAALEEVLVFLPEDGKVASMLEQLNGG